MVGKGTSYDVGFNVASWIDRPLALTNPPAATTYEATPAATPQMLRQLRQLRRKTLGSKNDGPGEIPGAIPRAHVIKSTT